MKPYSRAGLATSAAFLGAIVAANYVTSAFGVVPVGFGLEATAGTYFVGLTFILRDFIHDRLGWRPVFALIILGAALSMALSAPAIAVASFAAFLVSETADLLVYAPLRRRGYIRAAVASNVVGAVLDTVVFLTVAGFPIAAAISGQLFGKLVVTGAAIALVAVARRVRKARA